MCQTERLLAEFPTIRMDESNSASTCFVESSAS